MMSNSGSSASRTGAAKVSKILLVGSVAVSVASKIVNLISFIKLFE